MFRCLSSSGVLWLVEVSVIFMFVVCVEVIVVCVLGSRCCGLNWVICLW